MMFNSLFLLCVMLLFLLYFFGEGGEAVCSWGWEVVCCDVCFCVIVLMGVGGGGEGGGGGGGGGGPVKKNIEKQNAQYNGVGVIIMRHRIHNIPWTV